MDRRGKTPECRAAACQGAGAATARVAGAVRPEPPQRRIRAHGRLLGGGEERPVPSGTREQAGDELRHQVPACTHCRPDTALGFPD
ncbi:DUF6233 domain-containing protein [Streptomyces sp. NPDC059697]|uniref:DUF6233 domain-containing protein n=1 Tax=Streptomyces sp. NPDC059697 TaxID=3346912 RepID=UPI00368DB576